MNDKTAHAGLPQPIQTLRLGWQRQPSPLDQMIQALQQLDNLVFISLLSIVGYAP